MRSVRARTALVAGAITLAMLLGVVGIFSAEDVREAFAQSGGNEVEGVIEALPADGVIGTWQVAGRTVTVTEATEIDREGQTLAVGTWVEVDGVAQPDGSLLASEIEADRPDRDGDDDDGGPGAGAANTGDDDD